MFLHLINTLIAILLCMRWRGSAVCAVQCKVVLFAFSSWFAEEANVAHNNND